MSLLIVNNVHQSASLFTAECEVDNEEVFKKIKQNHGQSDSG